MLKRWWTYQKERFPIVKNGLLIALFSTSAVGYSLLLRSAPSGEAALRWGSMLLAFLTLFLFFLQLQIIGEFRDIKQDVLHHPNRPVPSGLVSLQELKMVGLAAGLIQLGLALPLGLPMVLLLGMVWLYLGLITQNFFITNRFKAFPVSLVGLAGAGLLFALYATACEWLPTDFKPERGLIWFLLLSLFSGLAVGLTINLNTANLNTAQSEAASEQIWGRQPVALAWLTTIWLMALTALAAGMQVGFAVPVTLMVLVLLVCSVVVAWRFWSTMSRLAAQQLQLLTGLWLVGIYCSIGILPLFLGQSFPGR